MKASRVVGTMMQGAALLLGVSMVALAIWVFLVDRYDPATRTHWDGLGRQLHHGSGVLGRDHSPGLLWEVIDTAVAIVMLGTATALFRQGGKVKGAAERQEALSDGEWF